RDDQATRPGHGDAGALLERHFGAVGVDLELLDEARGRAPGADPSELLLQVRDGLPHLLAALVERELPHLVAGVTHRASAFSVLTSVPIGSPTSARWMFPGALTSKTMIGSSLSMQKGIAVESITWRRRFSTSKCVTCSNFPQSGSRPGSAVATPSRPECVPWRMAAAPISAARSAAVVSVVKYGLPVPAANTTTRPFSRWRMARRGMYGSAI